MLGILRLLFLLYSRLDILRGTINLIILLLALLFYILKW